MGSERRARRLARALFVVPLLVAATAQAQQPSASEKETARSLMVEGRARRERSDARGALESFRAADAIMHVPTTGYELARAYVALGQLVEARDTLRRVVRGAARPDDPKPFVEARASAQALDEDLAQRIPSIQLVLQGVPPTATAAVEIDGNALPPEAAREPLKVNPGHHVVVARAGAGPGRAEVDVAERETKRLAITVPAPAADAALDASASPAAVAETPPEHGHTARTFAWVGFGLAGAGVVVGSITGLASISKTSSVKESCVDNHCPAAMAGDLDTARGLATVSTVAFAAAGAGLAIGIGALVFGKDGAVDGTETPPTARAHVTPWIGAGSAGLRGTF